MILLCFNNSIRFEFYDMACVVNDIIEVYCQMIYDIALWFIFISQAVVASFRYAFYVEKCFYCSDSSSKKKEKHFRDRLY